MGISIPVTAASIGAVPVERLLTAGTNMTGGGDLSADRTFNAAGAATAPAVVVTDATTARTIAAADSETYIRFTNAGAKTVTVDTNANVAIDIDSEFNIRNSGAGNLTISPEAGVTINPPTGGTLVLLDGMAATLKKIATDAFDLIGVTDAAP